MLVNAEKVVVLFNACFNLPRCLVWCFVSRKDAVGRGVGVLGLWVADEAEAEAEAEEEEEEETALLIFL
jgi:hypothetical protein